MKLLIADDHELAAAGTVKLLGETWPDISVATTIDGTIRLLDARPVDLLLLDVEFGERYRSGFDVLRHCAARHPSIRVILLTVWAEEWIAREARKIGAKGCIGKGASLIHLVDAVQTVLDGVEWFQELGVMPPLTDRQLQCLRMVAKGLTHAAIGRRLGCAEVTVDAHLKLARGRLGVATLAEALVKGAELGFFLPLGLEAGCARPLPGGGGGQC